jgi:hypothetical protein
LSLAFEEDIFLLPLFTSPFLSQLASDSWLSPLRLGS